MGWDTLTSAGLGLPDECSPGLMTSLFLFWAAMVCFLCLTPSVEEAYEDGHHDLMDDYDNNFTEPIYTAWYYISLGCCVWGVCGHVLVGVTILSDPHYRRHLCYLMVLGQLLLDFLFNIYFVVRSPITIAERRTPLLRTGSIGCFIEGNVLLCFSACSLLAAAFIAYGRYRAICTPTNPLKIKTALKLYVLIWVYCIIAVGAMDIFAKVYDNPGGTFCTLNQESWKVAVYVTFAGYIPGLVTAFVCYSKVYLTLIGNSELIGVNTTNSQAFHAKVAKKMCIFFFFVCFCWSPVFFSNLCTAQVECFRGRIITGGAGDPYDASWLWCSTQLRRRSLADHINIARSSARLLA